LKPEEKENMVILEIYTLILIERMVYECISKLVKAN